MISYLTAKKAALAYMCMQIATHALLLKRRKKNRRRRLYIRDVYPQRQEKGIYRFIDTELRLNNIDLFFEYIRMTYLSLLSKILPFMPKKKTHRFYISPGERLMMTLKTSYLQYTIIFKLISIIAISFKYSMSAV